jgi:ketosteroid isomerase-like protein
MVERRDPVVILLLAFAVALVFRSPARGDDSVREAIESANRSFAAALARGDAAALAAFYTSGAQVFPPNSDVVSGVSAIAALWQGVIDSGVKAMTLATSEVEARGDTSYEVGRYAMKAGDGRQVDTGKYVVVWKHEKGAWKLHRDIWNTSLRAR